MATNLKLEKVPEFSDLSDKFAYLNLFAGVDFADISPFSPSVRKSVSERAMSYWKRDRITMRYTLCSTAVCKCDSVLPTVIRNFDSASARVRANCRS